MDVIKLAKEAGWDDRLGFSGVEMPYFFERFFNLAFAAGAAHERERAWTEKDWGEAAEWIRQQEREACAKLALTAQSERMQSIREAIAAAIRARSKK